MPIDLSKNIRQRCHVNTNEDGDSFVGVKADTEDAVIYFPIGYQLPDNDDNLRVDIQNPLRCACNLYERGPCD